MKIIFVKKIMIVKKMKIIFFLYLSLARASAFYTDVDESSRVENIYIMNDIMADPQ